MELNIGKQTALSAVCCRIEWENKLLYIYIYGENHALSKRVLCCRINKEAKHAKWKSIGMMGAIGKMCTCITREMQNQEGKNSKNSAMTGNMGAIKWQSSLKKLLSHASFLVIFSFRENESKVN